MVNISAYTLCGDLAEHQVPGYHLPLVQHAISEYRSQVDSTSLSFGKYSPGFDDVKKTAALVDIVGQYYNDADSNDLSTLLQQLMGRLCPGVPHDSRADEHIDPDQWIPENGNVLPPILDLPLIDMSILAGALSLALNNGAADKSCINLLPWFAVARLGQICLHHELVSTDQSTVDSALWPSLWPLLAMFIDTEYMDAQRLSQLNVQNIALEWVTHIRACIHIFSRIPLNVLKYRYLEALGKSGDKSWLIAPLSTQVVNDAMVRGYMELLGIDLLVKSPEELMPSLRYWQSDCLETIGRSAENKVDTFSYRSRGRFLSYPRYRPFQLLPLPADYSRLHATITSQCSYEQPALCLVCGAILNSAGQGQCFTHSLTCNQGAGAYLLVQVRKTYDVLNSNYF
ncbi:hypothetical protein EON65_12245 [archaeon]|nr:MAG: hypothetical protein EON65_12245 [archaeon]